MQLTCGLFQNWSCPGTPPTLLPRATPLAVINKVPSIFAASGKLATPSTERQATPPADQKEVGPEVEEGPLDVSYMGLSMRNIVTTVTNPDPSCLYYEQYCIDEDFFRLGMYSAVAV